MKTIYEPYTGKIIRKIAPYTIYWEKLANSLARSTLKIYPCRHCGGPVINGYCCKRCGAVDP